MTTFIERIDQTLTASGCRYDPEHEQFMDGGRALELEDLADLLPEISLEELATYQDSKCDEWRTKRQ